MICIAIYHSYQRETNEMREINETNLYEIYMIIKLCCPHRSLKATIKS